MITVISYGLFFSLNPAGIQQWYTSNFIVPLYMMLTLPLRKEGRYPRIVNVVCVSLALVLLARQIKNAPFYLRTPEWPYQVYMQQAGKFLAEKPLSGKIGSWNAGIIGYYQGGMVINLDGLVNNDIYVYAKHNQLLQYIEKTGIEYFIDFYDIFARQELRERGGYNCPRFLTRLEPIRKFDDLTSGWHGLTLYKYE